MWLGRFLIATVCFAALGLALYGIAHLAGCDRDDRPHLVAETVGGQPWLRHALGFRLRHPGASFVDDRAVAKQFETALTTTCDAYSRADGMLLVCVIDDKIDSREKFAEEIRGARRGLAEAARQLARRSPGYLFSGLDGFGTVDTMADDVGWANGRGTAYLHVVVQGIHVRLKAVTIGGTLVVLFANGNGLDQTLDSFEIASSTTY